MSKTEDWIEDEKSRNDLPDEDDIEAAFSAAENFLHSAHHLDGMNQGERDVHLFNAGFYRGKRWSEFKMRDRELFHVIIIKQFVDLTKEKVNCMERRILHACNGCPEYNGCTLYRDFFQSWIELSYLVHKGGK